MPRDLDWTTLTDGEEVRWHGRRALRPYLVNLVEGVALILVGITVWLVTTGVVDVGVTIPDAVPGGLIGGVLVLLGLLLTGWKLLQWWSVQYLVTTDEVYVKRGIVSRTVTNLRLEQIQNTAFTQSVLGRLLSYGDVHIDTAGQDGTEIVFRKVDNPEQVVATVTELLDTKQVSA